jgi:hypothetical protein
MQPRRHRGDAARLRLSTFVHDANYGYGRNQTTCYRGGQGWSDVVVMVHDYQYAAARDGDGEHDRLQRHDVVIGSRILGGTARSGGMPLYKYVSNRFLTAWQNLFLGAKLSEYHTGYRAFSRKVLETLPLLENSDDFVFDNEMLTQCVYFGFRIGEVSCPTKYFAEASSINFGRSVRYGLGVLGTTAKFFLQRRRLGRFRIFDEKGKRLILAGQPAKQ